MVLVGWSPCQRRPIVGWVAHRCGCWLYAFGLIVVRVSTAPWSMEGSDGGFAGLSARCWVLREHAVFLSDEDESGLSQPPNRPTRVEPGGSREVRVSVRSLRTAQWMR